tara:strand:+ start:937 stop:1692 length:756 start_codon:yes stop_codon:yes gene_type:complete
MKNVLIIGAKSFISKNFINDFGSKLNLFFIHKYFKKKNEKNFLRVLNKNIKKNKINLILNFAAINNNSLKVKNFNKILESNFYLPITLIKAANKYKIPLFLFLSKDMIDNDKLKNFYSISKEMLRVYLNNIELNCKIRILNIDSIYGPLDLNKKRIFPSIFNNLYGQKKVKINLKQNKYFTYVKDVNKIIYDLIFSKKHFIYKDIKSQKMSINSIFSLLKKKKTMSLKRKSLRYHSLIITSDWYEKYYEKK